jgi:flagellar hook-basal body complex protein FliE
MVNNKGHNQHISTSKENSNSKEFSHVLNQLIYRLNNNPTL